MQNSLLNDNSERRSRTKSITKIFAKDLAWIGWQKIEYTILLLTRRTDKTAGTFKQINLLRQPAYEAGTRARKSRYNFTFVNMTKSLLTPLTPKRFEVN